MLRYKAKGQTLRPEGFRWQPYSDHCVQWHRDDNICGYNEQMHNTLAVRVSESSKQSSTVRKSRYYNETRQARLK